MCPIHYLLVAQKTENHLTEQQREVTGQCVELLPIILGGLESAGIAWKMFRAVAD